MKKPISVIIGNPARINANQQNENDTNPNREYPEIDQRLRDTYIAAQHRTKGPSNTICTSDSSAGRPDRLDDDGIIAFVTNRAYIDTRQDDGFRSIAANEFSDIYLLDLGSDVSTQPKDIRYHAITSLAYRPESL